MIRKGDVRCHTAGELSVDAGTELLHLYHFPGLQLSQPPDQNTLLPRTPHTPGSLLRTDPLSELEPQQQSDVLLQISSSLDFSDANA